MAIDLTIGIAGSGGDGVILLGELLSRAAARAGLHATLVKTFGPQIRGGETSARLRISDLPLSGADHRLDALLLFHWPDMLPFAAELPLAPETQLFVDSADDTPLELVALPELLKHNAIRVPLEELAMSTVRNKQAKNMVLCGVVAEYFGWDKVILRETIAQRFERHGEGVVAGNQLAVKAGRAWVRENLETVVQALIPVAAPLRESGSRTAPEMPTPQDGRQQSPSHQPLYFLSGNEAFSLGALHAGCRFMAGYPISPASEILEWMAKQLPRFGGQCVQAEDEIAAVCMAIGASYGGALAMTATSGPGFSLKQEAIGLAHMAELPLVVCDVQRCGPSTGIPTRTEQADLFIALHGGHGDNPRVVLAATTVEDCYELAHSAFEIAQKYQTPVIVLLDQLISQSVQTVETLKLRVAEFAGVAPAAEAHTLLETYRRYALTPDGVSPRTLPGTPGGEYVAVGIEHDEISDPTSSQAMHQAQTEKRFRKLQGAAAEYPLVRIWNHGLVQSPDPSAAGREEGKTERSAAELGATLGLLTWGSTYGVCAEAARQLTAGGFTTSVLAPQMLYPLHVEAIQQWIDSMQQIAVVELNFEGQLYRHLRGYVDLPKGTLQLNRAGGSPISLTELLKFVGVNFNLPAEFNRELAGNVSAE
ncbi:MAG: 2-oxoacid:acceptor oxidoreductase family protein [bacterium]|nr:2-oxoacid:acceptor oxidoreductase family protein [bacterium]